MKLAVVQMSMHADASVNVPRALASCREAAAHGAQVILLPELFAGPYFPQQQREHLFESAHPESKHPFASQFQALAGELGVVIPLSWFERAGQAHFNSVLMYDATGERMGLYRKSHIPDGPGYQEKYYFNPGDSGFKVWETAYGSVGVGICWDQWFPEAARCMALQGAGLLLYPTAIGSEPEEAGATDSRQMWLRAQIGHAVCNSVYLAAANRVGTEDQATFYGTSFICDYRGEILAQASTSEEVILYADLDLQAAQAFRASWGFFRDRRPDLYKPLLTLDGRVPTG